MTDIATVIEYIEWRNKAAIGGTQVADDFAGFVHDALSFSNTEARQLVSLLGEIDAKAINPYNPYFKLAEIIYCKLHDTYGDSAAEWKREQNQLLSDAIAKDIARGASND